MQESHLNKNVFWENALDIHGECAIVFSQSRFIFQVLCSGMQVISALVLGMTEIHFLSKNMFWQNADRYLWNGEC